MSVGEDRESFDALCLSGAKGVLGLRALDVREVLDGDGDGDDRGDGGASRAPSFDLASVLGAGAPGAPVRRIRVGAAGVEGFELVTSATLSVRRIARSALQPVPRWLAPLVEPLGVRELLLEPGALVLLAEPRRLASLCSRATDEPGAREEPRAPEEPGVT